MTLPLIKVCSGGQSGVDICALIVAKHLGYTTGGWMPQGWRTLDGPRPEYQSLYNMQEHMSPDYADRTASNVIEGDGTLRLAVDYSSRGELCTAKAIKKFKRPSFDVHISGKTILESVEQVRQWIIVNEIKTLNVAGNSEQTAHGIQNIVEPFLEKIFAITS